MKKLIDAYIEAHETAWTQSTLRSETARLRAVAGILSDGPDHVYQTLTKQGKAPYTIKTTFIRICAFEAWIGKGTKYKAFMKKHANRFKHAYKKEELGIDYDGARRLLETLPNSAARMASGLLATGIRISEAYSLADGRVNGKGGKTRKVFGTVDGVVPQATLRKALRGVGLKPHTLRKLCATRLAEAGATPADLCKVFGWSSISTAYQYLQAKDDDKLAALMEKIKEGY